ncbi:MAG TPA: hypothetical protein VIJ79_13380 [Acidobacteriaceae bacterium]
MESLDYWRLCEHLSVVQAAHLIVGTDPSGIPEDVYLWKTHLLPDGFNPVFAGLRGAILSGKLKATIRIDARSIPLRAPASAMAHFQEGGVQHLYSVLPDWFGTMIEVTDLREWLVRCGMESEFFFVNGLPTADYLNPSDRCFSAKLHAAIGAWTAVKSDSALTRNMSVKTALTIWLNKNAAQYGLTKKDGTASKQAIDEVSKVANWVTKGGAPKTPA